MNNKGKIAISLLVATVLVATGFLYFYKPKTIEASIAIHPRLLFSEDEIPNLRQKINDGFGEDDAAFDRVIYYADIIVNYSYASQWAGSNQGLINIPILGVAYHLSDESNPNKSEYQEKCKGAVLFLADTYDNDQDPHWAAHRIYSMSLGFDMCFDNASEEEKSTMVTEMQSLLTYISDKGAWPSWGWETKKYRPYTNNGGVIAGSSVGLASIAFRGEGVEDTLLDKALAYSEAVLDINLNSIFGEDGSYNEGVLYAGFAMRFFSSYIEARERYDGYDYGELPQISEIVNWLAYGIRPNYYSYINNLNDALRGTFPLSLYNGILDWSQGKYNSTIAKWLWEKEAWVGRSLWGINVDNVATVLWGQDIEPADPNQILPDSKLFSHRGLYYYRTGWPTVDQTETNDSVFSLFAGKFYGGHAQEDQGNFTLWSKGEDFIVDSGYGATNWDAHSIVAVDDAGQHNAGSSIGTDGNIAHHLINPFADYLYADIKSAYDTHSEFNNYGVPFLDEIWIEDTDWSWGLVGANPVEKANRYVLTVKKSEVGEYFVIFDDINKDGLTHKYDWTFHSGLNNSINTSQNPITITGSNKGNKLDIYFANPDFSNLSFTEENHVTGNSDGNNKRILATYNNVVNPEFFTILFPRPSTDIEPDFTLTDLEIDNGRGVKLAWDGNINDYIFYKRTDTISSQNIESNGKFTLIRKNGDDLTKFSLSEGSSLTINEVSIITSNTEGVSVASDGATISISESSAEYTIYGPNVTVVVDNEGEPVSFEQYLDYVYINIEAPADETLPATITDLNAS